MNNIILTGMPGCGKSTVGVVLAKLLCMDFIDTDLLIQKRFGKPLQQIIDDEGVGTFLEREGDVIAALDCENSVIATGGSAVLTERGRAHLRKLGRVIYIQVSCDELEKRLSNLPSRGVAMKKGETLTDLFNERRGYYESTADFTVDASNMTAAEVCHIIITNTEITQ